MKRVTGIILAMALVFSLAACQNRGDESDPEGSAPSISESTPESTPDIEENGRIDEPADSSILIAYFSLFGNANYPDGVDASTSASIVMDGDNQLGTTEYMARMIQENVGGDLHFIRTIEPYSTDFDEVVDQNHEEMNSGTLPALAESDLDVSEYDTIFIGYPVWATNAPRAIFSFLSVRSVG